MKRSRIGAWVLLACAWIPASGLCSADEAIQRAGEAYEVQNFAEAMALYEVAAEAGSLLACEILGVMYLVGEDLYPAHVKRDYGKAGFWLAKAAGVPDSVAQVLLARMESRGLHPPRR
jgi:TPR repeat protein